MTTPTLVTAKELGLILGRDEETIYRWARQKKVPHLRLPDKGYRFPLEEIIDTLRVEPDEEDAA
jgi:predicted site-specific integrase-resolvase